MYLERTSSYDALHPFRLNAMRPSLLPFNQTHFRPRTMNAIQIQSEWIARPVKETDGPNRSPFIDHLCRSYGVPLGSSWCALFACESFHEAALQEGKESDFPRTAGSQDLLAKLIARGCAHTHDPEVAKTYKAILLIRTDPGGEHGHVASVRQRLTDEEGKLVAVVTCEGNTNTSGGSNGDRAYEKKRTIPLEPYGWTFIDVSGFVGGSGWYGAPGAA